MWDYMHSYPGGGMGWGFGIPLMLLFWGLLIFAVIMLVRMLARGRGSISDGSGNRAIEILRERYARGEISLEEYEERKRNLEK